MKKWVGRAALAALGALVVYVALAALADVRALRASLLGFEWRALVLALAIVLAGYVVRALRWRLYLHRLAVHGPVGREALGFAASLTMGLASGKSGQVIKAYYLQLATGLPYSVSVPVTFAERIADAVSVLLLLALGLVLAPTLERAPSALAALALVALLLALRHPRARR
ncbi:MAG TPA: lysylphosphatidylglycerol synthase domain-containing protein, partial [Candidatus Thermoplasmatota archaeon]|nr:lysylphosphatidylglycerol synthase domain-containing protein [Candidatus Thermoplasmatota archaeon]